MNKKTKRKNKNIKGTLHRTIGWSFIILWILTVMIMSWTGLLNRLIPSLNAENSNLILNSILLIPIAIVSFLLACKLKYGIFTESGEPLSLNIQLRILYALLVMTIVVGISWWFFLFTGVTLYLHFRI